jgi:hypothetical protein
VSRDGKRLYLREAVDKQIFQSEEPAYWERDHELNRVGIQRERVSFKPHDCASVEDTVAGSGIREFAIA